MYLFEKGGYDINAASASRDGVVHGEVRMASGDLTPVRFRVSKNLDDFSYNVVTSGMNLEGTDVLAFANQVKAAGGFAVKIIGLMKAAEAPEQRLSMLVQACNQVSEEDLAKAMIVAAKDLTEGEAKAALSVIVNNSGFGDLTDSEGLLEASGNLHNVVYDLAKLCGFEDPEEAEGVAMDLSDFLHQFKA